MRCMLRSTRPLDLALPVMDAFRRLGWLLRQRDFRRLVGVRVPTQGADEVIQVGMASYVLINPQNQHNA